MFFIHGGTQNGWFDVVYFIFFNGSFGGTPISGNLHVYGIVINDDINDYWLMIG